jgi:hypothetical protein
MSEQIFISEMFTPLSASDWHRSIRSNSLYLANSPKCESISRSEPYPSTPTTVQIVMNSRIFVRRSFDCSSRDETERSSIGGLTELMFIFLSATILHYKSLSTNHTAVPLTNLNNRHSNRSNYRHQKLGSSISKTYSLILYVLKSIHHDRKTRSHLLQLATAKWEFAIASKDFK